MHGSFRTVLYRYYRFDSKKIVAEKTKIGTEPSSRSFRASSCILAHGGRDDKNTLFIDCNKPVNWLCRFVIHPHPNTPAHRRNTEYPARAHRPYPTHYRE